MIQDISANNSFVIIDNTNHFHKPLSIRTKLNGNGVQIDQHANPSDTAHDRLAAAMRAYLLQSANGYYRRVGPRINYRPYFKRRFAQWQANRQFNHRHGRMIIAIIVVAENRGHDCGKIRGDRNTSVVNGSSSTAAIHTKRSPYRATMR